MKYKGNEKEYQKEYRRKNKKRLREQQKEYYRKNREKVLLKAKDYYNNNKEAICRKVKEYRDSNPELIKDRKKRWRKESADWVRSDNASRRARNKKATPLWLTRLHKDQIRSIYSRCKEYTDQGHDFHVDHIIPLKGKDVSGLHVPWNLQIVTREYNLKKGIKIDYFPENVFVCEFCIRPCGNNWCPTQRSES